MGFAFCWEDRNCDRECSARRRQVLFCWRAHLRHDRHSAHRCDDCGYRAKWVRGSYSVKDFLADHDRRRVPRTRKKVLVIDGDPHILFALEETVGYLGHDCISAGDGEDGLVLAKGVRPDLIVTDVILPKFDGYNLCRCLRDDPATRHTPVIVVTTRDRKKDVDDYRAIGAEALIVKPFRAGELAERIEGVLSSLRLPL